MLVGVVAGNPKPSSRTLAAATMVARMVAGGEPEYVLDVVTLGAGLLGFGDPDVAAAIAATQALDVVVVASPTYKGAACGVLKCFLDLFPSNGLEGITALPMMLGAGPGHLLAPEFTLKPVLVELGASCPTRSLYLLDADSADPDAVTPWVDSALALVAGRVAP
jgi:FMN reductase